MFERLKRDLSYIEGLMEGSNFSQNSPEQKVIERLVKVVEDLVETTQHMDLRQIELEDYVDVIDEDLNDLELLTYGDLDNDDDENEMVELTCPECGEDVWIDTADLEDESIELLCPECHTTLIMEDAAHDEDLEIQFIPEKDPGVLIRS
ncbi:CD1247 N-terminal domain-containing protein [Hazenella coriacea]|uniref:DUF7836 domain-containing protein n=1 Tax=Hazenella coriacea TaxID=1179467 RepID=A0A4V2UVN1_9BACL|nr:CD1247 N-terminal domain-containing protein [Hazenella coriacea]TCS96397.1 hypothetical protein EDD58_10128 [Hazenella coriacea]